MKFKMGLGPPVCKKCSVLGTLIKQDVPKIRTFWCCPVCKSRKLEENLFTCGLSIEELDANLRFLMFMQGPYPS